jgi:hypothetical protein
VKIKNNEKLTERSFIFLCCCYGRISIWLRMVVWSTELGRQCHIQSPDFESEQMGHHLHNDKIMSYKLGFFFKSQEEMSTWKQVPQAKRESKTPTEEVQRWSPPCSVFMTPELVNLSVLIQGPDLLVFLSTEKSSSQHQWN